MAKIYGSRWRIIRQLGKGGQGDVYLVQDESAPDGDPVVLKRLHNARRLDRFVNEVRACQTLSHPNIIRVIDHSALDAPDDTDEKMYLVMPYMERGNLEERASMYKNSLDTSLEVVVALAKALHHAHAHGVIHRDVKPANVLFAKQDHVPTLSDFGICLLRGEDRATETGEVVGPRAFIAPELEGGGKLAATAAADVYSLGKLLYYLVSGGVVLPRERQAEPEFDIFSGRGVRHELLARLLNRTVCPVETRIRAMSEVVAEIERIQTWEQRSVPSISPVAAASLATIVQKQRQAESDEQHNQRIREAEVAAIERYRASAGPWVEEEIAGMAAALNHEGVSYATPVPQTERDAIVSNIPGDATGQRVFVHGFLVDFGSWTAGKHYLLVQAVAPRRRPSFERNTARQKLEPVVVWFVPHYYSSPTWQAFFAEVPDPAPRAATRARVAGSPRPAELPKRVRLVSPSEDPRRGYGRKPGGGEIPESVLAVRTTTDEWPTDVEAYRSVMRRSVDVLLDRVAKWSSSSMRTLE